MSNIYVDHAATTKAFPEVIEKMTTVMESFYGNPSSVHSFGRDARFIINESRQRIASSLNANEAEIIFTSGGTEANNLALLGVAKANACNGRHIITTSIEHPAVLNVCEQLEQSGFTVTYLPVNNCGQVCLKQLKAALREDTIIVSIMYGNNEVGTLQPIEEIGQLLAEHQAIFHTDAVQAFGITEIDVQQSKIDLLSASAHKIGGPQGCGFLYIKTGIKCVPNQFGGEQERKLRSGTENVAAIAGFAEAVTIVNQSRIEQRQQYTRWKKFLLEQLTAHKINFSVNGPTNCTETLPHILNISFKNVEAGPLLVNLDLERIAASSGSACTAGTILPSHVLIAMYGEQSDRIKNSIRFSFGMTNNDRQIEQLAERTIKIVGRLTNY